MRNMSCAMTTNQILDQSKTITRRPGWLFLKPGDRLQPVIKGMGLKKGEKAQKIGGPIEVVSTRLEPLNAITQDDVIAEGFPDWTPDQFVQFFVTKIKCKPDDIVNRIEFKYV